MLAAPVSPSNHRGGTQKRQLTDEESLMIIQFLGSVSKETKGSIWGALIETNSILPWCDNIWFPCQE
jgi:hypothetical protein